MIGGRCGGAWFGADGVNVWVTLPTGVDSKDMLDRCAAAGAPIADGEPFFLTPGRSDVVRLNAGSVITEDAAKAGEEADHAQVEGSSAAPFPRTEPASDRPQLFHFPKHRRRPGGAGHLWRRAQLLGQAGPRYVKHPMASQCC